MKSIVSTLFTLMICQYLYSQIITDSVTKSKDLLIRQKTNKNILIGEISNEPKKVTEVETAIPAFIGFTQMSKMNTDNDLLLKPFKISSMSEYERFFGFPFEEKISFSISDNGSGAYKLDSFTPPVLKYILYDAVKQYFENGGGVCYIVSAGTYQTSKKASFNNKTISTSDLSALLNGLSMLETEDEPTLIIVPEAVKLPAADYQSLVRAILDQCAKPGDRFAIFDLYDGKLPPDSLDLMANRDYFGNQNLKFGAVYYPFLKTRLNYYLNKAETNFEISYKGSINNLSTLKNSNPLLYSFAISQFKNQFVVLPPSAAVAGVYATVDRTRGVWKAPANVTVTGEPVCKVDNNQQESMNIDVSNGKSINVIRNFTGKGNLIWGARTLAGNDNEWRYVSVRRFFIMVEESVKKSTQWVVFEPNDANTWAKVRSMIEDYLTTKWRDGALMGSRPQDAFFVKCGLGQTMTNQDIIEGNLNIEIGLAPVRPAEFIILKLSHKIQNP